MYKRQVFTSICQEFGFPVFQDPYIWSRRHPFVFLVEAADDICYRIIDMEDAHRIKILGKEEVTHYFLNLISELNNNPLSLARTKEVLSKIGDSNESIAYLRTKCIGELVEAAARVFDKNMEEILNGTWNGSLIGEVEKFCPSLLEIQDV